MKIDWKVWYGDGSTYTGDPFLAPPANVQVVIHRADNKQGYDVNWGKDCYYWKDDRWVACDDWGLRDYMMMHIGPKAVLFGRSLRDEDFWAIKEKAMKDGL